MPSSTTSTSTSTSAPAAPPGPASLGDRMRGLFSASGTVTQISQLARHMRRIRIESDEVARLNWVPGQQVRVHVADPLDRRSWLHPRDLLRTYSVWNYDGGLELCVFDHDTGGPGTRWARGLRAGQWVSFGGPEGSFVLRDAPYHLFAGEETAAVAFGAMLRALPPGAPVHGVIEVDGPGDRLPLPRELNWEYRNGRPAAASDTLVEAVHRLELPPGPGVAYLAGEARTVQMLRRHLVAERGWPRQAIRTKPFWAPGRRGLD
jgi:NADPH-dependent ferric siderophore reductase